MHQRAKTNGDHHWGCECWCHKQITKPNPTWTFNKLVAEITKLLPTASFACDNEGQIIINTNLQFLQDLTGVATDTLVDMPDPE